MRHTAAAMFILLTAGVAQHGTAAPAAPRAAGVEILRPFDYQGVRLDEGPLREQVRQVRDEYLRVSSDSYLKGFRRRAGRDAPGAELGGWYGNDHFHVFGQVVSGLARLYAATGDRACKDKADALVAGFGECIEPDGYFFYSREPNSPHYFYDKMVCGLLDAHLYTGTPKALEYLDRITTWAEKNLDRSRVFAHVDPGHSQEWYTLSENLYRAYLVTGETRYRDFAKVWEYTQYWDTFARNSGILQRPARYHAYSHVNTFSGAAMAYRVSGERRYLDTIIHAYDYLRDHQAYVTGGYGPGEQLLPEGKLVRSLDGEDRSFETQCGAWAGFKLSKYLIAFTGQARYGDWIEALMINGTGASLPMSLDGRVTYYSQYGLHGGQKVYSAGAWMCCAGTRIQAVADYVDLVYFRSDEGLYVNLFTPSTCTWTRQGDGGETITLRQHTRFPEEPGTHLTISTARESAFALKIRRPGWLAGPARVSVNGRPISADVDEGGWITLARTWRDGDAVDVELPMALAARRFPAASSERFPAALAYGPTALALVSGNGPPGDRIDFDHLDSTLRPIPGEPLAFRAAADASVTARPLYAIPPGQVYYVYLDPAYRWRVLPQADLKRSGQWRENAAGLVSTETGAAIECVFEGTGVRWVGARFDDAGTAEVTIDNRPAVVVDQYGPRRQAAFRYEVTGLPAGRHTLRIVVRDERNPKSRNQFINVSRVEVSDVSRPPAVKDGAPQA